MDSFKEETSISGCDLGFFKIFLLISRILILILGWNTKNTCVKITILSFLHLYRTVTVYPIFFKQVSFLLLLIYLKYSSTSIGLSFRWDIYKNIYVYKCCLSYVKCNAHLKYFVFRQFNGFFPNFVVIILDRVHYYDAEFNFNMSLLD